MIEYKIIELPIPSEWMAVATDPEVRKRINPLIEAALNENGVDGWRLHVSGLSSMPTLVLERVVDHKPKKGKKT